MKRLFAAAVISGCHRSTAGCSSSVDNPPDVRPTDPTMGNGNPPPSGSLSPDRALFSPNQGILPYPHDAYFTPTPGVPTDGTLNLPSSAFFPATVRIPGTTTTEPVVNALDGFSTQAPIKLRFSSAVDITTAAAGITARRSAHRSGDQGDGRLSGDFEPGAPRARRRTSTIGPRPRRTSTRAARWFSSCRSVRCSPTTMRPARPARATSAIMVLVTNALRATNGNAYRAPMPTTRRSRAPR